jgi:hypothetical protein
VDTLKKTDSDIEDVNDIKTDAIDELNNSKNNNKETLENEEEGDEESLDDKLTPKEKFDKAWS